MSVWYFILIALAVWRLSEMLANTDESGPWSILDKIRSKAGVKFDGFSNIVVEPGSLAELITCIYCNSIWIGLLFVILYSLLSEVTIFVSLVLSLSAISIIIQELLNAKKA